MLFRPFFQLIRGRLIAMASLYMFLTLAIFYFIAGNGSTDFGVFWHSACDCPADPMNLRMMLYTAPILALYVGILLGTVTGIGFTTGGFGAPAGFGGTRFLLTRPILRRTAILNPFLIAAAAIALIPAGCVLLLFGWLSLVHAPSLHHFMLDLQLIPSVAALGPNPSSLATFLASHVLSFYLASISIGLCSYTIMAAQRWLVISDNKRLRLLAAFPILILFGCPFLILQSDHARSIVLMLNGRHANLDQHPGAVGILLHFGFAAALLLGSIRLAQRADLA